MENITTRQSPSSLRPVSFRYGTTNGHTPTIFAATSTKPGIERSFVLLASRNAGRDAIQSQVSAPFKRFDTNSATGNWSRLPNKDAAVRRRQHFISRRSNVGYSTSLAQYPLLKKLVKSFCQNMRTCMQRHNTCIWTSGVQKFSQNCSLGSSIDAESAQHRNTHTAKSGPLPLLHHHPNP